MWPQLLAYGVPAALSAYGAASEAARRGQGPAQQLAAAGLGAGAGLVLGKVGTVGGRMAGEKLASAFPGALGSASAQAAKAATMFGIPGPIAPLTGAAVGSAGALLGGQVAPLAAAPLAASMTGAVPATAAGAASYGAATNRPQGPANVNAVPGDVSSSEFSRPLGMDNFLTGTTAQNRVNSLLDARQNIALAAEMARMQQPFYNEAKKNDLSRQMAAAQMRSNIAVNAEQLLSGLRTAQAMGLNAQNSMAQGMMQQYQYG